MTILKVFLSVYALNRITVCVLLIFTAYMVRTGLIFLCVLGEKSCVHTQYASLSISLKPTIYRGGSSSSGRGGSDPSRGGSFSTFN